MQRSLSTLTETISSGPMLRELQRWTISTRVKITPSRWTDWTRSIIGRHSPVIAAGSSRPMTFVKRATLVELHERLINLSLNVYSRINLAIQPILREMRLSEERASRARDAKLDSSRAYLRGDAEAAVGRSNDLVNETSSLWPVTFAGRGVAEHSSKTTAMRSATNIPEASTATDYSSAGIRSSPAGLSLVFRRLRALDEFAGSRHRSEMIHEDAGRHALGLARQLQRLEQSMPGSPPEVARRLPATNQQAAPQVVATEHTAQPTLGMFKAHDQSWRTNTQQVPDAIVEQLTERVIRQIDQRTIAWRERMGKISRY